MSNVEKEVARLLQEDEFSKRQLILHEAAKVKLTEESNNLLKDLNQLRDEIFELKKSNHTLKMDLKDATSGKHQDTDHKQEIEKLHRNHTRVVKEMKQQMEIDQKTIGNILDYDRCLTII